MKNKKRSYLNIVAMDFGVPNEQISSSPQAIMIYSKSLNLIIDQLYDPEVNLAEGLTADFLDDVIRKDVARIRMDLKNYRGSKPSRDDIRAAKQHLDTAVSQISVVAKNFRMQPKNIQEEVDRLIMLNKFIRNLEIFLLYIQ